MVPAAGEGNRERKLIMTTKSTASAIKDAFISPNVADTNFEPANVVDVIHSLAVSTSQIASAIRSSGVAAGPDAMGGTIDSLTEAVMGVTGGLCQIAEAINQLADAVKYR
jgi:hypothetical protein